MLPVERHADVHKPCRSRQGIVLGPGEHPELRANEIHPDRGGYPRPACTDRGASAGCRASRGRAPACFGDWGDGRRLPRSSSKPTGNREPRLPQSDPSRSVSRAAACYGSESYGGSGTSPTVTMDVLVTAAAAVVEVGPAVVVDSLTIAAATAVPSCSLDGRVSRTPGGSVSYV